MILNWKLFLEELVGETPIKNVQSYIDGMGMSMRDKLFFSERINYDVIVDFGCAGGDTLLNIKKINPSVKLIGYDLDHSMISRAQSVLGQDALVTDDWNKVRSEVQSHKSPLLNLSSVIHEVYSYSNANTIKYFWDKQVFGGDFKTISIRDMIPSTEMHKGEINEFKEDVKKVRRLSDPKYLRSFENRWGTIQDNYRTFVHYLLKYKYTDNWDREVNENYLPVSLETLKTKIPSEYKIAFESNFILPFLQKQVKQDFGVTINHATHTKLIIKNLKFRK